MDWWSLVLPFLAFPVAALVHELGHALAGRSLGARQAEIRLGNVRDRPVTLRLGWLVVNIHLGARLWLTVPTCWSKGRRRDPIATLGSALAGPLAAALLVLVLWPWTGEMWLKAAHGNFRDVGRTWAGALAVQAALQVLLPLIPMHYRATGIDSDGLQVWNALRALVARRSIS